MGRNGPIVLGALTGAGAAYLLGTTGLFMFADPRAAVYFQDNLLSQTVTVGAVLGALISYLAINKGKNDG